MTSSFATCLCGRQQKKQAMEYEEYEEYEEIEPKPSRRWHWLASLLCVPFVYLFIVVPLNSLPEYVHFGTLTKFSRLSEEHTDSYERLILIGDVHGCFEEFTELLAKVHYSPQDHVVLLGDFISKGPDSVGVLDFAIEHNFSAVLGNHELAILAKYQSKPVTFDDGETYALDKPGNIKTDAEMRLARHLTPEQIEYLVSLPLVMDIGPTENGRGTAMHVGYDLTHDVDTQSINDQLALDRDWYKDFNDEMKDTKKKDRLVVYYGHNAKYGLNLKKYTKGLDSACVKGGQLSALVLNNEGVEQGIVQVECQQYV